MHPDRRLIYIAVFVIMRLSNSVVIILSELTTCMVHMGACIKPALFRVLYGSHYHNAPFCDSHRKVMKPQAHSAWHYLHGDIRTDYLLLRKTVGSCYFHIYWRCWMWSFFSTAYPHSQGVKTPGVVLMNSAFFLMPHRLQEFYSQGCSQTFFWKVLSSYSFL